MNALPIGSLLATSLPVVSKLVAAVQYNILAHSVVATTLATFQQKQAIGHYRQGGIYPLSPHVKPADDNRAHWDINDALSDIAYSYIKSPEPAPDKWFVYSSDDHRRFALAPHVAKAQINAARCLQTSLAEAQLTSAATS